MGSSTCNVLMDCIPVGSGVRDVKKGIRYHIEKREKKEVRIKKIKELVIVIVVAIAMGLIIACYLLHKAGY